MKAQERVNVKSRTSGRSVEKNLSDTMSKTVVTVTGFAGLTIGMWSFAALVGGLIAGGGPLGLAGGYIKAVSGV